MRSDFPIQFDSWVRQWGRTWTDGAEMNARELHGYLVALVARYGVGNVRIVNGMIEKRGTARDGRAVWHVMGKVN
jgi:hypothetical protein